MKVRIRLFAAARQAAGKDTLELDLPQQATVSQLRDAMARQVPGLASLILQAMFAIDAEYAADDAIIPPEADVACIPPVSGG